MAHLYTGFWHCASTSVGYKNPSVNVTPVLIRLVPTSNLSASFQHHSGCLLTWLYSCVDVTLLKVPKGFFLKGLGFA